MSQPNKSVLTRHDTVARLVMLLQHRTESMILCLPSWHFNTAHCFLIESPYCDDTIKIVNGWAGDIWATVRLVQRLGWEVDSWTVMWKLIMLHFLVATTQTLPSKDAASVRFILYQYPPKQHRLRFREKKKIGHHCAGSASDRAQQRSLMTSHAGWSFYVLTVLSFGFSFILSTVWSSTSDHRITSPLWAINIRTQGETNGTIDTLLRHELTARQVYLHELVFWYMILPHSIKGTVKEFKEPPVLFKRFGLDWGKSQNVSLLCSQTAWI